MTDWREDPIEDLTRELRQGPGSELRAEMEISEKETHIGRLRRRTLADLATEAVHRGDRVSATTPGPVITGEAIFAGKDYLVIETATEVAEVRLDQVALRFQRSPAGGHRTAGGAVTFRARLSEFEQTGEKVTLSLVSAPGEVTGRIQVVAADHLLVSEPDGSELSLPFDLVYCVRRPRPGQPA